MLALEIVDLHDRVQKLRMRPVRLRHIGQRLDVFRETAPTVADACLQEMLADASIHTHAARDLQHIRAQPLAHDRDLVDEADARGQKGVRGVLDHLGGADVGDQGGRFERRVQFGDRLSGFAVERPEHVAIRVHKIRDR